MRSSTEDVPRDLWEALRMAHDAAECGDYYCGCWDRTYEPTIYKARTSEVVLEGDRQHTVAFLASLHAQGWDVERIT